MNIGLSESGTLSHAPTTTTSERVSVVIPCYNEERFIAQVLNNLADQYDNHHYEIIIVDGMSEDGTREVIADFCNRQPGLDVRVVDNPMRNIPTALNLGITEARGELIARMDAHTLASAGYIRRCTEVLRETGAGVVGMPCHICPGAETLVAQAIACAVSHPFGIGDAKYRLREGSEAQEAVDTVAFGFFKKDTWEKVGGFNENLLTNEDYDFNYRVRRTGKLVLLDRSGHCDYFARTTLRGLARQYWRYGYWKAKMIRQNLGSIKPRHLVAPTFVGSLIVLAFLGIWLRLVWWLLGLEIFMYLFTSLWFAVGIARKSGGGVGMVLLLPMVFLTIHCSWGSSFLMSFIRLSTRN